MRRRFIVRKVRHAVIVLLLVSMTTSLLLELAPGDPALAVLGPGATKEAVAKVHADLKLDRPWVSRYGTWVSHAVRGDLGRSYQGNAIGVVVRRKVTDAVLEALPTTAELVFLAMLMALAISIPVAMLAAFHRDGLFDRAVTSITSAMAATPPFVTLPLLIFLFAIKLPWLPVSDWVGLTANPLENLHHALLPALGLALVPVPFFTATLREELVHTLDEDFILNAQAKGLSPRVILVRHAFRPSSFMLLTLSGTVMGALVGGAVIAEQLFALPGLGSLLQQAISTRDVNTVQGVTLFIAAAYVVVNAAIDVAYGYIDPRVRLQVAA